MPRSTREWAKRKFDQAAQSIDWAAYHLMEIEERYRPDHPEVSDNVELVLTLLVEAKNFTRRVKSSI